MAARAEMMTGMEAGVFVAELAFFDERLHTLQNHARTEMLGNSVEQYKFYWASRSRFRTVDSIRAFDTREAVLAEMERIADAHGG